ncbi:44242_t:CDS:2, partial [Gigaspora margarita]
MYNKNLLKICITLVVSITATATASLTNSTGLPPNMPQFFPSLDKLAPTNANWTSLVDQAKVPAAPVNPSGYACAPGADTFCSFVCYACSKPDTDVTFCNNKKDWAITYDDGPSNNTLAILDRLDQNNQRATFFVIAVGLTPKYMRPPLGDCDDRVRSIAKQLGYKVALWNHDTFDWKSNADPTYDLNWIPNNFTIWAKNDSAVNGPVTLEHDLYTTSASKAPAAADIVKNYGYTARQLANCISDTHPYVEK